MKFRKEKREFYGMTTLGEKGQVVIPSEARAAMRLAKGEKMLVFGFGPDMLAFSKLSNIEQFASHLEKKLAALKGIIKKTKKK